LTVSLGRHRPYDARTQSLDSLEFAEAIFRSVKLPKGLLFLAKVAHVDSHRTIEAIFHVVGHSRHSHSRFYRFSLLRLNLSVVRLDLFPNQFSNVFDFHLGTDGIEAVSDHG